MTCVGLCVHHQHSQDSECSVTTGSFALVYNPSSSPSQIPAFSVFNSGDSSSAFYFKNAAYKWTKTVCNLCDSLFFLQNSSLEIYSCHSMYQQFISFYSMVHTYCIRFNHLPTEGHLGCFQFWVIMKKADINIYVFFVLCIVFVWF